MEEKDINKRETYTPRQNIIENQNQQTTNVNYNQVIQENNTNNININYNQSLQQNSTNNNQVFQQSNINNIDINYNRVTGESNDNISKSYNQNIQNNRIQKNNKKKIILITIILLILIIISTFTVSYILKEKARKKYEKEQLEIYTKATEKFKGLYTNEIEQIPIDGISLEKIDETKKDVEQVSEEFKEYIEPKKNMLEKIEKLKQYITFKEELNSYFEGDVLKSNTTLETIKELENKYNEQPENFQKILKTKIDLMNIQFNSIKEIKEEVTNLFTDNTRKKVKSSITRKKYNEVAKQLDLILQKDVIENEKQYLEKVEKEIIRREEEEVARIKREKEIAAAWVNLNVPYISQNGNKVYNGCETASLLMALKYKGYLKDMDLRTYAENIPKSDDPYTGFTHSIYELEPRDVPHWIAPAPLAKYGRETSGNQNIVDMTGTNLVNLDKEIINGNPVIIYLTSKLNTPEKMIEGAPVNLHVLLLTGYNKITGEHLIIDPWTGDTGRKSWTVSREKVEKIYNATGKRAVVVR